MGDDEPQPPPLETVPTRIAGLDAILRGGLLRGDHSDALTGDGMVVYPRIDARYADAPPAIDGARSRLLFSSSGRRRRTRSSAARGWWRTSSSCVVSSCNPTSTVCSRS